MLDYVVQLTRDATRITPAYHERLRAAGFDDRAIRVDRCRVPVIQGVPAGDRQQIGVGVRKRRAHDQVGRDEQREEERRIRE